MELTYKKVPEILTSKDLDYLSDIFEWNLTGYKLTSEALANIEIKQITEVLKEVNSEFYDNLNIILDTINEVGEDND